MLDKNLANDVLTAAMSTGGAFAEIFVEETARNVISLINNTVEKSRSGIDYGVGIRIFDGTNAVYAYTNDTDRDSLLAVAKEAAKAVKTSTPSTIKGLSILNFTKISPMGIPYNTVPRKQIVDMLKQAGLAAYATSKEITQLTSMYRDTLTNVLICNTEGIWAEDTRNYTRMWIDAVASSGDDKQTMFKSKGGQMGFEAYEGHDFIAWGREAAEGAVKMLHAKYAPGGKYPVIVSKGEGAVLLHEACGHSLEAEAVAKKATEFADKIGQKVARDIVTVVDDGTIPGGKWGSINIDDEGHLPQKNVLVENGILKGFLVDKLNGLRLNLSPTGSARRESYRYAPTSRMTNTYIEGGTSSFDEIISATEFGLFAKAIGGGSVDEATGEFNFSVDEAYMIRNGKLAEPVRGASLIGKGSEVMANIDMLGNDFELAGEGSCGAASGWVPTSEGQPTTRVSEMTVGGRSEE
ncbi:MAG: TldD/PmbA family protein [Defluviitaleaceae bacterium]|nr:TldD/PmbA family protein [Defluviitaleaceae bacterium]